MIMLWRMRVSGGSEHGVGGLGHWSLLVEGASNIVNSFY
jgi:hypothetical protein